MPALTFAGGKLALAYYDLRDDASGGFDDLVFEYGQAAYDACYASQGTFGFAAVYACILTHPDGLTRRHTLDMRASLADTTCLAAGTCDFTSYSVVGEGSRKVSRYIEGRASASLDGARVQLQYNRPNLPLFSKGRFPFIGDYIDIAGEQFVATAAGGWAWNTGLTANRPAPVFHASWADNRNVGTPRNSNWEQYTPPVAGPNSVVCVPGQVGVRNQDIYTAQLRPGLVVTAPANSKRLTGLQRSFVVVARNATTTEREYMMEATPAAGVIASFDQFSGFGSLSGGVPTLPVTRVIVRIPGNSTASRTLFVSLVNPPANPNDAPDIIVPVKVTEVQPGTTTSTGVFDGVFLNPDFENPDFENPDFENAELHNPDFENPDFENPDFENPDFENFTLSATSAIRNPDFENPDFENPDFENPDFENPDFENPGLRESRLRESRLREPRLREPGLRESRLRESRLRERQLPGGRHHVAGAQQRQHDLRLQGEHLRQRPAGGRQLPVGHPQDLREPRRGLRRARLDGGTVVGPQRVARERGEPERADQPVRSLVQRSEPQQRHVLARHGRARPDHAARLLPRGQSPTARAT